jgi:hypothetical protein
MPGAADTVERVGRVLAHLRAGDDDDAWLAGALADWKAGQTLDQALGLHPGWREAWRPRARDAGLRRIATRHFPELQGRALASAMHLAFCRYGACFPRDRRSMRRPSGLNGAIFDYLLTHKPLAFETLRNVLR